VAHGFGCRLAPAFNRRVGPAGRTEPLSDNDVIRSDDFCCTGALNVAHLLLIDDDPALIPKQVRQVFTAPAHWVEVAHSGADGLERVRAEPPDVVLLDLRLPDQSGLDVFEEIRRLDARIPSSSSPWPRRRTRPSRR
jgi:hypothetical protein